MYDVIRSGRRTVALEVTRDGRVLVRAPQGYPQAQIEQIVTRHRDWVSAQLQKQRVLAAAHPEPDARQRELMIARARRELPGRVAYYARKMGLYPAGVTITGARKRFGSCSGKNRLCFSWRLMQYPPEAVDYVVVHELAHIAQKNHGSAFYALIMSVLPDYRQRRELLRQ